MKIHFIAGLPRSGSTLLAALLRQNPRFIAGMTSPACKIFRAIEFETSRANDAAVFLTDEQKRALRLSVFSSIYPDRNKVVFDTNRLWTAKMPALVSLFPDAKFICCVRDVSWIMDSFERVYRDNPMELSGMFDFATGGTVYTRVAQMAASSGVVGRALDALREGYYGEYRDRMMLINYDDLALNPPLQMNRVYSFINEKPSKHDYGSVVFDAPEFDADLGMKGLHSVRPVVSFIPRQTVLPPDLFNRFRDDAFWTKEPKRAEAA